MYKLAFDPYEIDKLEVEGVGVYLKSLPWANDWLEVRVGIHAGAFQDEDGKEGTAHFFEHLPFNGTAKYPTFEKMEELSRTVFMDSLNAYTSMMGTCFTGKVLLSDLEKGLDVLREMMFFPVMSETEVERERKVIIQEIWQSFSNEKREKLVKEVNSDIYGTLPYSKQVRAFGWSFTVPNITQADLKKFHKDYYHKNNLIFVIAGDVSPANKDKIIAEIKKFLKDLPAAQKLPEIKPLNEVPLPLKYNLEISDKEYFGKNAESISKRTTLVAKKILPKAKDEDAPKLWIGRNLLRQLIFNELRGKFGATYSPQVRWIEKPDHEYFEVALEILPELKDKAIEIIKDCINKVSNADKSIINIFEESKNAGINNLLTKESSGDEITDGIIHDLFRYATINTLKELVEYSEKVTFENMSEYIKKNIPVKDLYWYIQNP